MTFTHNITLDITFNDIKTINIKQYTKNSHILHITLTDKGIYFSVNKNELKCYFKMITPDKKHIFINAIINADGSISVFIPEKACLSHGNGKAELQLVDSRTESVFLSMDLNVYIVSSVYENDGIISSDDFDALNKLLIDANKNYLYVMENAEASAKKAESYAVGGTGTRTGENTDNAKYYKEQANSYSNNAKTYADNSKKSASDSAASATSAENSKKQAEQKASDAASSASDASKKAKESSDSATLSKSYAVGGTSTRTNEDTDNSKYYSEESKKYYEQSKNISESLSGALRPMGTVTFSELPTLVSASDGDMYNVSDQFTTTTHFEEGSGHTIAAGSNVYKTANGKWDVLAGSLVTGIKGTAESTYRKGNVDISKDHIGLGNVGNFKAVSTSSQNLTEEEKAAARNNINALPLKDEWNDTDGFIDNAFDDGVYRSFIQPPYEGMKTQASILNLTPYHGYGGRYSIQIGTFNNYSISDPEEYPDIYVRHGYDNYEIKKWGGWTKLLQKNDTIDYARKLSTPRTIQTDLSSQESEYFDGSENISPGVSGILSINNGGTGNSDGKLPYCKQLWAGAYYMSEKHIITFSEPTDLQPHGIVLVFAHYEDGTVYGQYNSFFVPKDMIYSSYQYHTFFLNDASFNSGIKTLRIHRNGIMGEESNVGTQTTPSGIKCFNSNFVLNRVYGV